MIQLDPIFPFSDFRAIRRQQGISLLRETLRGVRKSSEENHERNGHRKLNTRHGTRPRTLQRDNAQFLRDDFDNDPGFSPWNAEHASDPGKPQCRFGQSAELRWSHRLSGLAPTSRWCRDGSPGPRPWHYVPFMEPVVFLTKVRDCPVKSGCFPIYGWVRCQPMREDLTHVMSSLIG